jgi:hypothetical protein
MVSVGFRPKKEPDTANLREMNAFEWLSRMDQILIDSESTSNHYFSERMLNQPNNYYSRFEATSLVQSYDSSTWAINQVAVEGEMFLRNNMKGIERVISQILQEKYGGSKE